MITAGENSQVEFKRDDLSPAKLAAEMVALLNYEEGYILLGVEDTGMVSGLTRTPQKAEEWVMQVARDSIQPRAVPGWQVLALAEGVYVAVITLPRDAPHKPYKAKQRSHWVTKIRMGTTTQDATREEEQRFFQESGGLRYGLKPVLGSGITDLDSRRLQDYFIRVRGLSLEFDPGSEEWRRFLCLLGIAVEVMGQTFATIDGMLLFGLNPGRFLMRSGVRAVCYPGKEPDYTTIDDEAIRGPLLRLRSSSDDMIQRGIVERAVDFVRRNTGVSAHLVGARRVDRRDYPEDVVREIIVNSLIHRDYSIEGTDVLLQIFSDRIEVESPGKLPNTITIEQMRYGQRYARNQTLVDVMRDYGYDENLGRGISMKVIPGMKAHNGTEPEFIAEDYRFTVRLWK